MASTVLIIIVTILQVEDEEITGFTLTPDDKVYMDVIVQCIMYYMVVNSGILIILC